MQNSSQPVTVDGFSVNVRKLYTVLEVSLLMKCLVKNMTPQLLSRNVIQEGENLPVDAILITLKAYNFNSLVANPYKIDFILLI